MNDTSWTVVLGIYDL